MFRISAAVPGSSLHTTSLHKFQANTELCDRHGNTPLMLADKKGNKEVVKLLTTKRLHDYDN